MRRRQGAADGHLARARARTSPRRSTSSTCPPTASRSSPGRRPGARSTRMVGGLIMAHGDDNGLRRAAAAGAGPGRRSSRSRPRRPRRRSRLGRRPAGRAGVRVARRRPRPTCRSAGGRSTGSSRACRCGSRSGRATWPRAGSRWSAGSPAARRRCRWPGCRRGSRPGSSRTRRALLAEATRDRDARITDVDDDRGRGRGLRDGGWARLPWSELGEEGEAELAESAVTVRCLHRADGSLPETGDEPDLVAYVARAY